MRLLLSSALLFLFSFFQLHAEAFYIKNYQVEIAIHEDGRFTVTEDIAVFFTEERRGIFRKIPYNYEFNGNRGRIKIFDIDVVGWNYRASNENGYRQIRIGDAMQTLKGLSMPIDFLFLDGWKDLYLPLFQMLEPQFHSGTLIYADNMDMNGTQPYADYVWSKKEAYSTQIVHGGKAFLTAVV